MDSNFPSPKFLRRTPYVTLLFAAVPLLLFVSANGNTYERVLPSGKKVICDRCPPGTHLHAHCTDTRPTDCRPCSAGFYTEIWNYIPECLPCVPCALNQEETQSCTPSQNRVCQCKEGYYWLSHFCKKHTVCSAGQWIKNKGTPYKDTECEPCRDGHYANGAAGITKCTPHTACKGDEKLVIHGTNWHDNMCVTCNNVTTEGWPTLIKPLLSELFAQQKQRRLQRLYRILKLDVNDGALQSWLSTASEQQLTDLPAILIRANLHSLADKVEQKIERFQEEAKYCSNNIM
ncbi:tumor necrosis factor receptor superfamily member 6B-like [Colossoma macropomum]|uniref:tumor necrosis factor receptor superfamily member 6B-like n=1 Tax=Colossoma macropomum TaxID=42526 RepID=UPI001864AFFC|nr:tumor necrosis factor receptor superfamily member 6B-like [Colossoma macropomum]